MEDLRIIDLKDWEAKGKGSNAVNYFHLKDDSIMLKVNSNPADEPILIDEYNMAKKVMSLPINTPKVYDLARTDDGRLCIVYERIIGKKSISSLCAENPEDIEKYARLFAEEAKKFHQIPCDIKIFKNHHDTVMDAIRNYPCMTPSQKGRTIEFVESLKETGTCLHGDLNPGNLVIDAQGKPHWIDLGAFDYGNPMHDMGIMYTITQAMSFIKFMHDLTHMDKMQLDRFWKAFSAAYIETDDPEKLKAFEEKCAYSCCASLAYRALFHENKKNSMFEKMAMKTVIGLKVLPRK